MTTENDTFGPWTPPGGSGRPPDDGATASEGEPTTPAIVDAAPFWSTSGGILDLGNRTEWERCQLGAIELPGLVHVNISKPAERKVDVKSPDGKTKAKVTVKGWEPAEVQIQLLMWTPAQWAEWRKIRPQLRDPTDKKESDPFEIEHPVTYDSGISAVIIKNIGGLENGTTRGTKTVKISAIEWTAEAKNTGTGTPKGAKSSGSASSSADRKSVEQEWLAMVAAGSPVSWEELARANGIDPPGPPPPVPPESDYNNPNYWDDD